MHYIWHQDLQFSPKTNALLTILVHQYVSFIHNQKYTLKIPFLLAHYTRDHYANNLFYK